MTRSAAFKVFPSLCVTLTLGLTACAVVPAQRWPVTQPGGGGTPATTAKKPPTTTTTKPTTKPTTTTTTPTTAPTTTAPTTTTPATTTTTPTTTATTTAPTTPPVVVPAASASSRPFSATSPFNTPIPAGTAWYDTSPLHNTPAINGDTRRHWWVLGAFGVYYAQPTDPIWTFNMPAVNGGDAFHRSRPAQTFLVRAPANIVVGTDTDKILVVVDGTTYYELWDTTINSANRTVTGRVWATGDIVTGPGAGTLAVNDGVRATNFSWAAGLITGRDLANPTIDHALAIALPGDVLNDAWESYVYPATAWDNNGATGPIKSGSRLGIPAGTARPAGLTPMGIKIFDALVTYGAYVGDFVGGSWPAFYADANTVDVNSRTITDLYAFWDNNGSADMEKIAPLLRVANYQP